MLTVLFKVEADLPRLLRDPTVQWNNLEVLYEEPRVERLWTQVGDNRIYLHRIYPCLKSFYHPHPWPSAIRILKGIQAMKVGFGDPTLESPIGTATTLHLAPGTAYEMTDPWGWHSVMPWDGFTESLMVTGKPWATGHATSDQKTQNRNLEPAVMEDIFRSFRAHYPVK